jgi:hypothetical protein
VASVTLRLDLLWKVKMPPKRPGQKIPTETQTEETTPTYLMEKYGCMVHTHARRVPLHQPRLRLGPPHHAVHALHGETTTSQNFNTSLLSTSDNFQQLTRSW